jgi:hypothetical protein
MPKKAAVRLWHRPGTSTAARTSLAGMAARSDPRVDGGENPQVELRELGILNWVRRCAENWRAGRFVLEQQTNAYAVLPESH